MPHQAILVEQCGQALSDQAWICATLTVHPAQHPTFSHYKTLSAETAMAAVADYRDDVFGREDVPVGLVGEADGGPDWTILDRAEAIARGTGWDGVKMRGVPVVLQLGTEGLCLGGHPDVGHRAFAPAFRGGLEVFARLQDEYGFISRNDILSLEGLRRVYRAVARCAVDAAVLAEPLKVIAQGRQDTVPHCAAALRYFADALAATAGDICLEEGVTGSVALSGDLCDRLIPALDKTRFRQVFLDKGAARATLDGIDLHFGSSRGAAMRGLASVMVDQLTYTLPKPVPADVEGLDRAWHAQSEGSAWALDRSLRVVHRQNIAWSDHHSAQVPLKAGTPIGKLLHAMEDEGLLSDEESSAKILRSLQKGEEVQFRRFGCGGRVITCTAQPVAGGYIIAEASSDASAAPIAKETMAVTAIAAESSPEKQDILDLQSAEDQLDAAVAQSPLVHEVSALRVLIAEPNLVMRTIMKAMVRQDGYDPVLVETAEAAFAAVSDGPDIILCDAELGAPADLVQRFRRGRKRALLLALSAGRPRRDELLKAGFDGVLPKPPSHEAFSEWVAKWQGKPVPTGNSAGATAVTG
ncbi:MAG: glucokinase [Parvularcula sp.]